MPVPEFIADLRQKIGHDALWLPGVTAAIFKTGTAGVEVLLVRQVPTGRWTLIGGCIEPGEDPDVAAIREVAEETGIDVDLDALLWIRALPSSVLHNEDVVQYLDIAFRGAPRDDRAPYVGDDESDAVGWFGIDELPPLLERHQRLIEVALTEVGSTTTFGWDERKLTATA